MAALLNKQSIEAVLRSTEVDKKAVYLPAAQESFDLLNQLTVKAANQEKNWKQPHPVKLSEESIANLKIIALWQQILAHKHNPKNQTHSLHQLALLLNIEKKLPDPRLHKKLAAYATYSERVSKSKPTSKNVPSTAVKPRIGTEFCVELQDELADLLPAINKNLHVVKQALSEAGLLIPPYNSRLKKIYEMVDAVTAVYESELGKNGENLRQAQVLLACLNNLVYNTDSACAYEDAEELLSGKGEVTHPVLKKAFSQLKKFRKEEKLFYQKSYGSVYRTFLEKMGPEKGTKEHLWLQTHKGQYPKDDKTKEILDSILEKLGAGYLESVFNQCFSAHVDGSAPDYKVLLNNLLQKLKIDFIDTQRFDMTKEGLSESRKQMLLKKWKHSINRFARKHGLSGGIVHRGQLDIDLDVSDDLITKLNHYINDIQTPFENSDENLFAKHAAEYTVRIGKFKTLKANLDLLEHATQQLGIISIDERLITELNALKYKTNPTELGTLLKKALTAYEANQTLETRNNLLKFLKKCKKRLGLRAKKLRNDLIDTLDETLLPYTLHEKLYEWQDSGHTTSFRKKRERKLKKWISRPLAEGSTVILTFGQACMSFYAAIFFFPLIGPAAFPLAGLFFLFTLVTNYILLRASTIGVLKQLIVKRDFFVGFKNPGGKLLIGLGWTAAACFGLTLAFLTFLSAQAMVLAIAVVFPPLAPVAEILAIGIASVIGLTTAVGFTALYFVSIASVITGICHWLEKKFPEIAEQGWGFTGLMKGLWHGGKRICLDLMVGPKSLASFFRGVGHKIGHFFHQQYRYYWSDPTGNPKDDREKIWRTRITHILGSIFKWTFVVSAIALTVVGIYAELVSWNAEIANFLTRNGVNQVLSTWIAGGLVFTFTAAAEYIFTFRSYTRFFVFLADTATSIVDKAIIHPITTLFQSPKRFWKEIIVGYTKSAVHAVTNYLDRLIKNPRKTLKQTFDTSMKWVLAIFVGGNAIAQGAFVLKGAVTPAHVDIHNVFKPETAQELTNFADVSEMTYVKSFAYAGSSAACNANEARDYLATAIPKVPLTLKRDRENAQLAEQKQLNRQPEVSPPEPTGEEDYNVLSRHSYSHQ